MKKRIFSVLVCLAVLVSTTMFQVGASYQPTDARQAEIDALIAKTDSHVLEAESINTSEVLPFIQASAVYEQDDGTQTPVDVDLQIQKLGTLTRAAGGGTLYEVKASTKKEEGSAGGGRKVQANATLYWIDNIGPVNELYRVKGEWFNSLYDTANPESAGVLYGEFPANVPGDSCVAKHPNAMSFDYYADDITGYTLGVQTSIKCEKNGILYLIVTSSIFS